MSDEIEKEKEGEMGRGFTGSMPIEMEETEGDILLESEDHLGKKMISPVINDDEEDLIAGLEEDEFVDPFQAE